MVCTPVCNIYTQDHLKQFLTTSPGDISGKLAGPLVITSPYSADISTTKYLDGSGFTISQSSAVSTSYDQHSSVQFFNNYQTETEPSYTLFKTDSSLTLHNLTVSGFHGNNIKIIDSSGLYLGLSGCTFRDNSVNQHIFVEGSQNVTDICNSLFSFVSSSKNGGAITSYGKTLSIYDSSFISNSSSTSGGAIYSQNEITISGGSTFAHNHATGEGGGGALYAAKGGINLDGSSTFLDNSAYVGGALYTGISGVTLLTGPYEFSGNHATNGPGGAIYSMNDITISGETESTFAHNHASGPGGALYAAKGGINLDGSSTFLENSAHSGGALAANGGITLNNKAYSEFSGNKADTLGGAIFAGNTLIIDSSLTTFSGNAALDGSNIYMLNFNPQTSFITDDVSTVNDVHPSGLENNRAMVITTSSEFNDFKHPPLSWWNIGNTYATVTDAFAVGVIRNDISLSNFDHSCNTSKTFYGSVTRKNGKKPVLSASGESSNTLIHSTSGEVHLYNLDVSGFVNTSLGASVASTETNSIYIHNCYIHDNSCNSGNTIRSNKDIEVDGISSFVDNRSGMTGGALCASSNIKLDGIGTFVRNHADGSGGALYAASGGIMLDGSFSFVENSGSLGGALYTDTSGITLRTGPYEFSGNHATNSAGGAIYSNNEITITGGSVGTFAHNHASGPGGALYADFGINLDGSFSFLDNSANYGGGALYTDSSITLSKGPYKFSGNRVTNGRGGAIFSMNDITISGETGSTFTTNHADGSGGALYAASGGIMLDGSFSFVENSGSLGGALYTDTSGITLRTGPYEFSGNHATAGAGGAIYSHNDITISGGTFAHNLADGSGGALYAAKGGINLDGSFSFVDNSGKNGGALYTDISGVTLSKGPYEFSGNRATLYYGGAIYSHNDITITGGTGSTFAHNNATGEGGGALYAAKGGINLDGSFSFLDNSSGRGGALCTDHSGITLLDGPYKFSRNMADTENGGAIYSNNEIIISGDHEYTFTRNHAYDLGGALYAKTGRINLDGSFSFVDNSAVSLNSHGGALYTGISGVTLSTGPYKFSSNRADNSGFHIWAKTDVSYNIGLLHNVQLYDPPCHPKGVWVDSGGFNAMNPCPPI